ncbi:MAG: glycosyltransferase family 2 protein [Halomonas sp.]|nr:glycosyltransferase family A protein [Halomonas sp.]MBR2513076.1 glycosyltransferase family 2 protein [Halomonas sp.]
MGTVCFIVDALVTGARLPRHLHSIRQSGHSDHLVPIIVTHTRADNRLADLEQRYQVHCVITPLRPLGARLNQAAYISQAEWLVIALKKKNIAPEQWDEIIPQLDTSSLDALIIVSAPPRFSSRLLQRFMGSAITVPPYIAIRRAWLERLGGFDPELDEQALIDLLQRLYACPTRLKTISSKTLCSQHGLFAKGDAIYPHHASHPTP